jgi:TPR repeat
MTEPASEAIRLNPKSALAYTNRGNAYYKKNEFEFPLGADTSEGPNEQTLIGLNAALVCRVANGPSEPRKPTPQQQQQEVRARLKIGERHKPINLLCYRARDDSCCSIKL